MFSSAIIATDLSKASYTLVQCAKELVPAGTKNILLLQCVKPFEAASEAFSESSGKMESMLKEQGDMLKEQGLQVASEVVFGSIPREINRMAEDRSYAYIIIGSHGQSLARDIFLGSTAAGIIHSAKKPVLLVRLEVMHGEEAGEVCRPAHGCRPFNSSLLFPTDFSKNADKAFAYLEELIDSETQSVTLLHVQDMSKLEQVSDDRLKEFDQIDDERLGALKEKLHRVNEHMQIETEIVYGKPSVEIIQYAQAHKPAGIVMGRQGKGYVRELLLGSVSHTVARHAPSSVFLVPGQ